MRIAAAQYPIERVPSVAAWQEKLASWVADAAAAGAELLVFPEYAGMELTAVMPDPVRSDLHDQIQELQALLPAYFAHHERLAREHRVWIAAGSQPVRMDDGSFRNRVAVFGPGGPIGHQDKRIMTRFEDEEWHIAPGQGAHVFDLGGAKVGVAICYDVEFPLVVRRHVEQGARLILAPSCTDTEAGFYRVRIGAQARALENQCYVVQAPTWGEAPWSPALDVNTGVAAVYAPPDRGFPPRGIVAEHAPDRPGWLFADLDLGALDAVRQGGQVLNERDWRKQ